MADYSIKSGDCLWNIVKSNYNVSSSGEIRKLVNQIAEENNIKNPDRIYAGSSLVLPETDSFIRTTQETVGSQVVGEEKQEEIQPVAEKTKADELQEWNSYDNAIKASEGENIEEFEMFDAKGQNMSTEEYFKALAGFSQSVVDKYDVSGDGKMDEQEFGYMMTDGLEIEEYSTQTAAKEAAYLNSLGYEANEAEMASGLVASLPGLIKTIFAGFQMDDDNKTIGANELASQFLAADLDANGNVDGKLDFGVYNSYAADPFSATYQYEVEDRKYMYDNFLMPNLKD